MSREGWMKEAEQIFHEVEEQLGKLEFVNANGGTVLNRHHDDVDHAISKIDRQAWDRVVRSQLKERKLEYAGDEIYEVILRLAGAIAVDRIKGVEARAQKRLAEISSEYNQKEIDRKRVFQPFVELLAPLVQVGLMPDEQIISIAVRDSSGGVRIIPVDHPDTGLD
jgi:uncharacterized protein YdcH (DUF465 family)